MASSWCGNILLNEFFKNTKTYQSIRGQQLVRPFLLYLEEFNLIDNLFTPKDIQPVLSVVISY